MKKVAILFFGFVTTFLFFNSHIDAQIIEKINDRTFSVKENFIEIRIDKEIRITDNSWIVPAGQTESFTIFFPDSNDPDFQEKVNLTKESINLVDSKNNELDFTTQQEGNRVLKVSYQIPRDITTASPLQLQLSYNAYGLIYKNGAIRDLYIPAFPKNYSFQTDTQSETVKTTIAVPKPLGEINFTTLELEPTQDDTNWYINIPQDKLIGETHWIQIGKEQFFNFSISQNYNSATPIPIGFNYYTIPVPRNITSGGVSQTVWFKEITPKPYFVEKDRDGNLLMTFRFLSHRKGSILIEGYGKLEANTNFDITDSGSTLDNPEKIESIYVKSGKYWEVDNEKIQNVANELQGEEENIYKLARKTYSYVVDLIDYDETKKFGNDSERQGALKTLDGGSAVCMEYSDLFIALMRAQGVGARAGFGHGYSPLDAYSITEGFNHQWAEIYYPAQENWVSIDTTWGENGNEIFGGDLNHIYSHVASKNPVEPSTTEVKFVGNLGTIPPQKSSVETIKELPEITSFDTPESLLENYGEKSSLDKVFEDGFSTFRNINNSFDKKVTEIIPKIKEYQLVILKLSIPFAALGIVWSLEKMLSTLFKNLKKQIEKKQSRSSIKF